MSTPFDIYIKKVETGLRGGKAAEHTCRSKRIRRPQSAPLRRASR